MKMEHIALYVKDLEKARSFFMEYLDAKSNRACIAFLYRQRFVVLRT